MNKIINMSTKDLDRIYKLTLSSVYPHYESKVNRKGQDTQLIPVIFTWLTGYDKKGLEKILKEAWSFEKIFNEAPAMNPNVHLIKGSICGYKIQEIEDPFVQKIRFLDKLIDELANGKQLEKILRK